MTKRWREKNEIVNLHFSGTKEGWVHTVTVTTWEGEKNGECAIGENPIQRQFIEIRNAEEESLINFFRPPA